jgi:ADP-ribose pyrophosphatase YjhB (NUDIX family)
MLGLLALLQWRLKTPPVFALAEWVGGQLGPVIETYHGVSTRREIEQEIGQIIRQGSLPNLYDLVNNPEKRQSDERGFAVAVAAFAAAEREIDGIEKGEERRFQSCRRLGRRAAATAAAVISMVVIATALLVRHV